MTRQSLLRPLMQVPLIDGMLTCPKCGRIMRIKVGKYGAEISNSCSHSFRLHHIANGSLVAEFDQPMSTRTVLDGDVS